MTAARYGIVIACIAVACANNKPASEPTDAQPSYCDGLSDIRRLPYFEAPPDLRAPEEEGDDASRRILSHGSLAIPCLIDSITIMSTVPDPRAAYRVPDVRVGDVANMLLIAITGQEITPPEIAERHAAIGSFAILEYTQNKENAGRLQSLWRSWYHDNAASAGRK